MNINPYTILNINSPSSILVPLNTTAVGTFFWEKPTKPLSISMTQKTLSNLCNDDSQMQRVVNDEK